MTKILVVRRDNIGDLVCTLPLVRALRQLYPAATIDILVNSYSAAVVENNPDIDHVYVYTKAKHRDEGVTVLGVHWRRLCMTLSLRRQRYDWVVLANVSCIPRPLRWARQVRGRRTVGFVTPGAQGASVLTDPVPLIHQAAQHEVEYLIQLVQPFLREAHASDAAIQPPRIYPDTELKAQYANQLMRQLPDSQKTIGINISARKPSQQWPAESFIELIRLLTPTLRCVLYWSPGSGDTSGHPGDDAKAQQILEACAGLSIIGMPTQTLAELIAALAVQDIFITADGGAMHLGAALGKPIVALFGDSTPAQWRPWGVPQRVLQPESLDVRQITPIQVHAATQSLMWEVEQNA